MKQCSKCQQIKSLDCYHKASNTTDGYYPSCKECRKKLPTYTDINRRASLKRNYGLTIEQKQDMIDEQDGKCKICGVPVTMSDCVDHCHKTGNIRGILCQDCNKMLGYAKDNVKILTEAIKYLHG